MTVSVYNFLGYSSTSSAATVNVTSEWIPRVKIDGGHYFTHHTANRLTLFADVGGWQ